jgi:hypothetical protein
VLSLKGDLVSAKICNFCKIVSSSIYIMIYVMNNTCIHIRAEDPNIYMYKRGRIYKEPPGEIQ